MENKSVSVVTGGASGMGLACAKELGKQGPVVISGRYEDRLLTASEQLTQLGVENYIFQGDTSDLVSVKALADFASGKGTVKYVVNCAGISGDSPDANRRKVLEINALGTVNVTKSFYPILGEGGVQINISSMGRFMVSMFGIGDEKFAEIFSKWDSPDFVEDLLTLVPDIEEGADLAYTISKAFTTWFTEANTVRYARHGARVLSVSPGHYNTRMMQGIAEAKPEVTAQMKMANPMGRWGEPEEIGTLVGFLCSPQASYITGTDILTDGGFSTANVRMKDFQIEE